MKQMQAAEAKQAAHSSSLSMQGWMPGGGGGGGGGNKGEGVTLRAAVMVGTMSLADEAEPAYLQNCCTAFTWSSS